MSEMREALIELIDERLAELGIPCECHKPKHEARKPHENTMAGRK